MLRRLLVYNGEQVNSGDIIQRIRLDINEITYFLYEEITKDKSVLHEYDKNGQLDADNVMRNIYIDEGIQIINNELWKWTKIGAKEDVYVKIFQR